MARRVRFPGWRLFRAIVATCVTARACGGDKATGPAPCDTYTGGILSGDLPGTYTLTSVCQGMKPNLQPPAATGTVTLGSTSFTASITIQSVPVTYSGTYTTTNPDGITVDLTSPFPTQIVGTYRLRNDSLAVSGMLGTRKLSLVGTRVVP